MATGQQTNMFSRQDTAGKSPNSLLRKGTKIGFGTRNAVSPVERRDEAKPGLATSGHFGPAISPVKDKEGAKIETQPAATQSKPEKKIDLARDAFLDVNDMVPFNNDSEDEKAPTTDGGATTQPTEQDKSPKAQDILEAVL
mmetsp:Transcript_7734/g.9302  ORF Transcript_7734/g.9302 Transcript_7734/m.9302 type:complete len:141 (-) Transcript_7734:113-535(-)|eukprot:CAMPEP_0170451144 /NCGR_PEP_ID=MMETSP0123-20130129/480_1 /TAXON_ID=182087 /ORGANISM="Favella ehrenbergii, Strain Fehren 1" /LENGTH=140 /DNA_ID=CAMNT_0010712731 /DNA_START=674 /DNA_END=1096 /DNA_ORIENTATION=+